MNFQSVFIYIILPAISAVLYFLHKKYSYFKQKDIPFVKPSLVFGNLSGLGKTAHLTTIVREVYEKTKGKDIVAGFFNLIQPVYIITDPDTVKHILIKDFNSFVNRSSYVNEKKEPVTANLTAVEDDHWRFLRNKLSPAFTSGKMKLMFEIMKSKGDVLAKTIGRESQHGSILVKKIVHKYTLDTISSVAFGMEANTLNDENPDLEKFTSELVTNERSPIINTLIIFALPKLAKFLNLSMFGKDLNDYFYQIISENIKYREKSGEKRNDFLNMLVDLKNKGSIDGEISKETKKLTMDQCVAQGFIFIIGGSDTSSTTMSFAMCEIAKNPDIQDRLRAEIADKTKATNGEITYENLHEMTYLNQVVNGSVFAFNF
jgi:cytochrome P450 family 6